MSLLVICRAQHLSQCHISEHQELARELQQPRVPSSPQTTADLEKQLENLVDMMETKNEQIGIVQKQLSTSRRKARD